MVVSDSLLLQRMDERVQNLQNKIKNIGNLIKAGEIRTHGDVLTADKGVVLETIYGQDSTVTVGKFTLTGGRVSDHMHEGAIQYIVCVKGSFNISTKNWSRIIQSSECASIPKSMFHSVTALENDSELIAVCVPEDKFYKKSMNDFK